MLSLKRKNHSKRNQKSNGGRIESLESRQLMAADAFNFDVLELPEAQALQAEMYDTVDALAQLIQQQLPSEQIELRLESDAPSSLFQDVDPATFQPIVDGFDLPGLGDLLGQDQQLAQTLNDMVILELVGVPDEAPEYSQLMDQFVLGLDYHLELFEELLIDTPTDERLPPHFEQLRLELGDEGFANWLQSNAEQVGNLVGISERELVEMDQNSQREVEQVDRLLNAWLDRFANELIEPPVVIEPPVIVEPPFEPGLDFEPVVPIVPGDANADGIVGFDDFLHLSRNFGMSVEVGAAAGDFNLNGIVDFPDFLVLSENFGANANDNLGNIGFGAGEENSKWEWAGCGSGDESCGYTIGNAKADWQVKFNNVIDKNGDQLNGLYKAVITYRFTPNGGRPETRTLNRWVQFTNGNAEVTLDHKVADGTVVVQKAGVSYRLND